MHLSALGNGPTTLRVIQVLHRLQTSCSTSPQLEGELTLEQCIWFLKEIATLEVDHHRRVVSNATIPAIAFAMARASDNVDAQVYWNRGFFFIGFIHFSLLDLGCMRLLELNSLS